MPADCSTEFETELDQITADITEAVDCLSRLSGSIRNPAPHDILKTSTYIDLSHYETPDISHIASKFPLAGPKLAEHIGKANSRRRRFFKYRESYNIINAQDINADFSKLIVQKDGTVISSVPPSRNGNKALVIELDQNDEDELSDSGISHTSYATSRGNDFEDLQIPALPREASKGRFECQFCHSMISVCSKRAWR